MREHLPALRARARLSLLLAALLYAAGGVAEPRLHAPAALEPSPVVAAAAQDPGSPPEPQEERFCFACQVLGGAGLPAIGASLPELPLGVFGVPQDPDDGLPHPRTAPAQARSPPSA